MILIGELVKLMNDKNFICESFLCIKKDVIYVKLISKVNGFKYMMYIPSKYSIRIQSGYTSYQIKEIYDVQNNNDIAKEYGYDQDNKHLESLYQDTHISDYNVSEHKLVSNYKNTISIEEKKNKENENLKCLYRQVRRLKYSVESLDYKVVIFYKTYICCIHRDNDIQCFYIKGYPHQENININISFDLECFYKKYDTIHDEIVQVKKGIDNILSKNYIINMKYIKSLLQKTIDIDNVHHILISKKQKYQQMLDKLTKLLLQINRIKNKSSEKVQLKGKIIQNIIKTSNALDNLILLADKILFDNIIMFDKISKNLNLIKNI